MKTIVFVLSFFFSMSVVALCDTDTTSTPSSMFSENLKILRNGTESKIDSVVEKNSEIFIYIDGNKTPVKKNKKNRVNPAPTPVPDSVVVKHKDKIDSASTIITAGTSSDLPWWVYVLTTLGVGGLVAFALFKAKDNSSNPTTPETGNDAPAPVTSSPTTPTTPTTSETDNRFVPAIDPNHAPAFENMPAFENFNSDALPEMLQRAYARQSTGNLGLISEVLESKFGRLNGRFTMQHADGTSSVQHFENERGVKSLVRFTSGQTATVYSRFSCLNNIRGLQVAEIENVPTFTEESKVEISGTQTVTTEFHPESVPTEITEIQENTPESPTESPELIKDSPSVKIDSLPTETVVDPTVTVEIDGRSVTAPLSVINLLLKK